MLVVDVLVAVDVHLRRCCRCPRRCRRPPLLVCFNTTLHPLRRRRRLRAPPQRLLAPTLHATWAPNHKENLVFASAFAAIVGSFAGGRQDHPTAYSHEMHSCSKHLFDGVHDQVTPGPNVKMPPSRIEAMGVGSGIVKAMRDLWAPKKGLFRPPSATLSKVNQVAADAT